jgi:hypothetical protein
MCLMSIILSISITTDFSTSFETPCPPLFLLQLTFKLVLDLLSSFSALFSSSVALSPYCTYLACFSLCSLLMSFMCTFLIYHALSSFTPKLFIAPSCHVYTCPPILSPCFLLPHFLIVQSYLELSRMFLHRYFYLNPINVATSDGTT